MSAKAHQKTTSPLPSILEELRAQEPIFHRPQSACTLGHFANLMALDYWEVGASGRIYTREFILQHLAQTPPIDATAAGWLTSDFACRCLAVNTFLVTYALNQNGRLTRRATVWQQTDAGWQILYHQGTIVQEQQP